MQRFAAGDDSAFDELVEGFSGPVYSLLTRFLGHRHDGREDLVQEVFIRIFRARDRYEPTARFTTWLYSIVYRLAINESERRGRRPRLVSVDGQDEGSSAAARLVDEGVLDPSAGLERSDVVDAVRSAIASLPESQRMALVLAKYHDFSYVEIGAVLGSSDKAIKSLVHRARETLRERLSPFMDALTELSSDPNSIQIETRPDNGRGSA